MKKFTSTLVASRQLTHDVYQYDFDHSVDPIEFKAGQFFMMEVPTPERKMTRSYSVASAPSNKNVFSLCVKLIPGGIGSEKLRAMNVGDTADFMAPFGHFFMTESQKDIVMIATGTGLAPFMSMLPDLFEKNFAGKIDLFFGVRHEEDLFYVEELRAWEAAHPNFRAHVSLSQPTESWTGLKGRVTDQLTDLDCTKVQGYICGNGDMVKTVKTSMQEKGIPKEDLHWEQFTAL